MPRDRICQKARVTSKGQITVPKAVRETLGLRPGDDLEFFEDEMGAIRVRRDPEPFLRALDKWTGHLKHDPLLADKTTDEVIEVMRGPGPEDELRSK